MASPHILPAWLPTDKVLAAIDHIASHTQAQIDLQEEQPHPLLCHFMDALDELGGFDYGKRSTE